MTSLIQRLPNNFGHLWRSVRTPWTITALILLGLVVREGLPQFGSALAQPGQHFGPLASWLTTSLSIQTLNGWEHLMFWLEALTGTLPYIVGAVALIAALKATGAEAIIARAFQGNQIQMIFAAALFGGLAPFCSCEVIPFVAALLAMRVPLAPVMAFWLSSPLIDPPTLLITASALGWTFAIAKAIGAVALGLFGGFTIKFAVDVGLFANPLKDHQQGGCGCGPSPFEGTPVWRIWRQADRRALFRAEAQSNARFLIKWLALAYAIETLLVFYMPAEFIAGLVGGDGLAPIALGALVGMPAYLNSYAAPPTVAGLMAQGMGAGAAMSFILAGAVSSIPAATAVWSLVRTPVFISYLALGIIGAMLGGMLYQFVV